MLHFKSNISNLTDNGAVPCDITRIDTRRSKRVEKCFIRHKVALATKQDLVVETGEWRWKDINSFEIQTRHVK